MKLKALLAAAALTASASASAGFLCSYDAYISNSDRYNSSGARVSGVGPILQQDRANHWNGDFDGDSDCFFSSKSNRMKMSGMLKRGSITGNARNTVLRGSGWVTVDVYSNKVVVY